MHLALIAFAAVAAGGSGAPASSGIIDDQVFLFRSTQCHSKPNLFQTGFRVTVKGKTGLVTALHGVVGCSAYMARRDVENGTFYYVPDLHLAKVDRRRDVAFFVSDRLAGLPGKPLEGGREALAARMTMIGYPQNLPSQISSSLWWKEQPRRKLQLYLTDELLPKFKLRNSPDPTIEVLGVTSDTPMQAGYSGAPVIEISSHRVVAIANGGLKGGLAQINWVIPFADIEWEDVDGPLSPALAGLTQPNVPDLFASTSDTGPMSALANGGTTISGRIIYNGHPVNAVAAGADAVIELMDVASRQLVPADVQYDRQKGTFTLSGVPPGRFTPFVRVETGYPFNVESAGDFYSRLSGLNDDIVVAPHTDAMTRDLEVVQVVHLTRPVDNQSIRTSVGDPPETLYRSFYAPSAELFAWDPVPGAAYYEVRFLLQERGTGRRLGTRIERVTQTSISPDLAVTPPNTCYSFLVYAYNSAGKQIGMFNNYYRNGSGGWFDFTVSPGPG